MQATVIFPDGTTWNGVSGHASREKACPLTLNHHLFIGSITKPYIAASVMDQVEKGAISLDDTLDRWLDLPYADAVTVRMLLNHTSGIPNYAGDLRFAMQYRVLPWKAWRNDELLTIIRRHPLEFEPGTQYQYSSSNYVLLVEILEAATGRPYDALLREEILEGLGLQDTYFLDYPSDLAIANAYDRSLVRLGPIPFGTQNVTGFRPSLAGVIVANSEDVALFLHGLFTGQILTGSGLDEIKSFVQTADSGTPERIGYGLGIERLVVDGQHLLGHTGFVPGYSAVAVHNEEGSYTIVILSNLSLIKLAPLLTQVQEAVLQR